MKASNRIVIVIAIFVVTVALGMAAYTNLEIYPRRYSADPSAEVSANRYIAVERWLGQTGHPVRVSSGENVSWIVSAKERAVIVEESALDWENAEARLLPWIRDGGALVITLDIRSNHGGIEEFISRFGIGIQEADEEDEAEYNEESSGDDDAEYKKHLLGAAEPDTTSAQHNTDALTFDTACGFVLAGPLIEDISNISVITDSDGIIRLVTVSLGKGTITFTGILYCMTNQFIEQEANARLAWSLTAAQTTAENPKVLFIRDRTFRKGIFGRIAERGNYVPLVVSALALIVIGFWMVIPSFGIAPREEQPWARPITERFLAETRFLKKYNALDHYVQVYVREITPRSGSLFDDTVKNEIADMAQAVQPGGKGRITGHFYQYRDIIKSLKRLETIAERLQWNK